MRWSRSSLKVIQVFLEAPQGEFCGSDLMSRASVSPGVVYPFLLKWEEEGFLESRWEDQDASDLGRPRRKFYRLTRAGKRTAREALKPFVVGLRAIPEAR